jgi:hypothetical protein
MSPQNYTADFPKAIAVRYCHLHQLFEIPWKSYAGKNLEQSLLIRGTADLLRSRQRPSPLSEVIDVPVYR